MKDCLWDVKNQIKHINFTLGKHVLLKVKCSLYRLQKSQPRPASPSVSGLKTPQRNLRGMSPNRTGLPLPARSSLPKPGGARGTGLPTPRRYSVDEIAKGALYYILYIMYSIANTDTSMFVQMDSYIIFLCLKTVN